MDTRQKQWFTSSFEIYIWYDVLALFFLPNWAFSLLHNNPNLEAIFFSQKYQTKHETRASASFVALSLV